MAEPLTVKDVAGDHAHLGEAKLVDLSTVDVVLLRQDPPFDLAYIATTHFLERIHPQTLVVNDPRGVRDSPEKLFVHDLASSCRRRSSPATRRRSRRSAPSMAKW